jgi:hypothetical protein
MRIFVPWLPVLAVLATAIATPVAAADPGAKKRCSALTAFFDRWGSSRSEHSDGARNHVRIAAGIECERGRYETGIEQMETLLLRKNFDVPLEVGEAPLYEPVGRTALAAAN